MSPQGWTSEGNCEVGRVVSDGDGGSLEDTEGRRVFSSGDLDLPEVLKLRKSKISPFTDRMSNNVFEGPPGPPRGVLVWVIIKTSILVLCEFPYFFFFRRLSECNQVLLTSLYSNTTWIFS